MLKTLMASTALASVIAMGAAAQTAPDPAIEEPPAATTEQAPAEVIAPEAETAEEPMMAPETETAEEPAMAPETDTAEEPAMAPETDIAEDPELLPDATDTAATGYPPLEEGWTLVEVATLSGDSLIGTAIENPEGENIAEVNDVILSADGQVEALVAEFGGFLGFGTNTVELAMDEVQFLQDPGGVLYVRSNLTPEQLEGRPEYVAEEEVGG